MSFDWHEYFILGRELAARQASAVSDEALLRTAISRVYYSVYHRALAVATTKDHYQYPRGAGLGAHEALIQHFLQYADGDRQAIAGSLETLRNLRVRADYYDRIPPTALTRNNVLLTFALAESTLRNLAAL
jgi:uncharacterized protein (UPF0332 family)